MSSTLVISCILTAANEARENDMPTKHIDDETWRKVEKEAVKATISTKRSIKETEMLRWLILKGLDEISEEDYAEMVKHKK